MWVPKWQRDQKRGVDSPIPTQVVSNEEFVPRPQTAKQRQWEKLIDELSEVSAVIATARDLSSAGYSQISSSRSPANGWSEALKARWEVKVWFT